MYRPCRIVCPRDRDSGNSGAEQPSNAEDDGGSEEDGYDDDGNDEPTSEDVKKETKSVDVIQEEGDILDKKKLKPTAPETLNLSHPRGTLGPHATR